MNREADDTPEGARAILAQLSEKLAATDGVDKDLAAIVTERVLVEAPSDSSVAQAKADILALAERRATPAPVVAVEPSV